MIYAKKVESTDPRFKGRDIVVASAEEATVIPVPDTEVGCNGCNKNIYPNPGYMLYLSKEDLTEDLPYDFYCGDCLKKYFPTAEVVS